MRRRRPMGGRLGVTTGRRMQNHPTPSPHVRMSARAKVPPPRLPPGFHQRHCPTFPVRGPATGLKPPGPNRTLNSNPDPWSRGEPGMSSPITWGPQLMRRYGNQLRRARAETGRPHRLTAAPAPSRYPGRRSSTLRVQGREGRFRLPPQISPWNARPMSSGISWAHLQPYCFSGSLTLAELRLLRTLNAVPTRDLDTLRCDVVQPLRLAYKSCMPARVLIPRPHRTTVEAWNV